MKKGGRTKGTPNKVTQEVRECYKHLLNNNIHKLQTWIDEVGETNPAKALDIMLKMSEFVIPKLNRVEVVEEKEPINIPISMWVDEPAKAEQLSGIPQITFVE